MNFACCIVITIGKTGKQLELHKQLDQHRPMGLVSSARVLEVDAVGQSY